MFLLRYMLIRQGEKRETSSQNLQRNDVARQVEGLCISYFASFNYSSIIDIYEHILNNSIRGKILNSLEWLIFSITLQRFRKTMLSGTEDSQPGF